MEPLWVELSNVNDAHKEALSIGGGASGVRDIGLLESAIARPRNLNAYGEDDIFILATAYVEGIAKNHPFVDGNKRTAFLTCLYFLAINGYYIPQRKSFVSLTEKLAQGLLTNREYASKLKSYSETER